MKEKSCILFVGKKFTKTGFLHKTLGHGGSARVNLYKSNNKSDLHDFIVKELVNKNDVMVFINEFQIGNVLEHENIMKIFDIDVTSRFLLLEYYKGVDLFSFMENDNRNFVPFLLHCYKQLLSGVQYLHENKIAHLDLKLENIIVNVADKTLKITDFGLSDTFRYNKSIPTVKYFGTLNYLPPEIIEYDLYFPDKVDIWYCGIVLYNIMYDYMPWGKACYKTDDMYFVNEIYFKRGKLYFDSFELDEFGVTKYQQQTIQKIYLNIFRKNPVFRCDIHELVQLYDDLYSTFFQIL